MSQRRTLYRTYDDWKTDCDQDLDPEQEIWNPDCTCSPYKKDKYCPVHGIDPDYALQELRDRQMEKE